MITCAMITMNCGKDIPGSTIKYFLNNQSRLFDRILIVDGNLTQEAQEYYFQFKNVEPINSPWQDSHLKQYEAFSKKLKNGEWCLFLDDDELLHTKLSNILFNSNSLEKTDKNMFWLPCVLHLTEDGKKYYPAEDWARVNYTGQWTKHILFKKDDNLRFNARGSHVVPTFGAFEKWEYLPAEYLHMKSLQSFVINDCWQAFMSPEGQGFDQMECAQFKLFKNQFKDVTSFKKSMVDGTWSPALKRFAWQRRWSKTACSRLAWTYYILYGHPMPEEDKNMTWDYVKQFVLSKETMDLYYKNKELGIGITI